jgi:hypothetical protein
MVYFKTKNSNLGKFWRAIEWKMLVYVTAIWHTLWPFAKMYGHLVKCMVIGKMYGHLVKCMVIWCSLWSFGMFGPRKIWQPCPGGLLSASGTFGLSALIIP